MLHLYRSWELNLDVGEQFFALNFDYGGNTIFFCLLIGHLRF